MIEISSGSFNYLSCPTYYPKSMFRKSCSFTDFRHLGKCGDHKSNISAKNITLSFLILDGHNPEDEHSYLHQLLRIRSLE